MTEAQFHGSRPCVPGFAEKLASGRWRFQEIRKVLEPPLVGSPAAPEQGRRQHEYLARVLEVASSRTFKAWKLLPSLRVLRWVLAAAAVAGVAWFVYSRQHQAALPAAATTLTLGAVGWFLLAWAGGMALTFVANRVLGRRYGRAATKVIRWRETLRSVAIGVAMAFGGFLLARLHLHVFDKEYLRYGRVRSLPR
jgi:hypothetical protein